MKLIVTCLVILQLTTLALTQAPVIMRHSNGTVTPYYTMQLQEVISDAVDGDTIYLPGGNLVAQDSLSISKRLAIIGAGHDPDSTGATGQTILSSPASANWGKIFFESGASGSFFSGIHFEVPFLIFKSEPIENILFHRCATQSIYLSEYGFSGSMSKNITFREWLGYKDLLGGETDSVVIENSFFSWEVRNLKHASIHNSICGVITHIDNSTLTGNVIQSTDEYITNSHFGKTIFTPGFNFPSLLNNNTGNTIEVATGLSTGEIFIDPNHSSFYDRNYHLDTTNPALWACNCASPDGDEYVGIYAGDTPYQPGGVPDNPHIFQKTIASASNADGTLPVHVGAYGKVRINQSAPDTCRVAGYEYWFDTDYEHKTSVPVTPARKVFTLTENIDLSGLPLGPHTFHIRFRDDCGQWSSVCTNLFLNNFEPPSCMADAGPDISICPPVSNYPHLNGIAGGGVPPYTYTWSAEIPYGLQTYYASDMLDDTTSASPKLINVPGNKEIGFQLTVTDAAEAVCSDSVLVRLSAFIFHPTQPMSTICPGASRLLQMKTTGGFPPYDCFWYGGPLTGADCQFYAIPTQEGVYEYNGFLTDQNGCSFNFPTNTITAEEDTIEVFVFIDTCDIQLIDPANCTTQILPNPTGCDTAVITCYQWVPADTQYVEAYTCDPSQAGISYSDLYQTDAVCWGLRITTFQLPSNEAPPQPQGPETACPGETTLYTFTDPDSLTNVGYIWQIEPPDAGAGGVTNTPVFEVTWNDADGFAPTVSVAAVNGCGDTSAFSVALQVENPFSLMVPVCAGDTTTITFDPSLVLEWNLPASCVIDNNAGIAYLPGEPGIEGIFLMELEDPGFGITTYNCLEVSLQENQPMELLALPGAPYCQGDRVVLGIDTNPLPGSSPQWNIGGTGDSLEVTQDGYYKVRVQTDTACAWADTVLFFHPLPVANISITDCELMADEFPGLQYVWVLDSVLIPGANQPNYSPVENGIYHLIVIDENGCSATDSIEVDCLVNSWEAVWLRDFRLFPNPNQGVFQIEIYSTVFSADIHLEIFNAQGGEVYSAMDSFSGYYFSKKIYLDDKITGIYFLKMEADGVTAMRKFILK